MSKLTPETVSSVARKLDEFAEVLTAEEQAVLIGILGIAESAIGAAHEDVETEGGSRVAGDSTVNIPPDRRLPKLSEAFSGAFSRLSGLDPAGPISDSVGVGVACVSWSKDYNKDLADRLTRPDQIRGIPGLKLGR